MPSSDRIVTAKLVLQAQLELQRLGLHKAASLLESAEPDLAEVILETTTRLYHLVLSAGASAKEARRIHRETLSLVLVCVIAVQKAHRVLWQEGPADGLSERLGPPEGDAAPPSLES